MLPSNPRLGVIGFGEVGYHVSKGLKGVGISQITAYNNGQRNRPPYTKAFRERAESAGVKLVTTAKELAASSDLILSTVIPKTSVQAVREVARFLTPEHLYVDLNSCSAEAKQEGQAVLKELGGRYVDAVILGAPLSQGHKTWLFASGKGAEEFRNTMSPYGMRIRVISGKVGDAALLKLLQSVVAKGIQALLWESLLAMHKAGLDVHAYDGLNNWISNLKLFDEDEADRIIGHSAIHAGRRAGEMEFAADSLRSLGVEPVMTEATVKLLSWCASFNFAEHFPEGAAPGYNDIFRIIDTVTKKDKGPKS